jgi:hypothetical protein
MTVAPRWFPAWRHPWVRLPIYFLAFVATFSLWEFTFGVEVAASIFAYALLGYLAIEIGRMLLGK